MISLTSKFISKIPALWAVFLIQKEAAALSVSLRKKTEIAAWPMNDNMFRCEIFLVQRSMLIWWKDPKDWYVFVHT